MINLEDATSLEDKPSDRLFKIMTVVAIGLLVLSSFVGRGRVAGDSMEPTYNNGDDFIFQPVFFKDLDIKREDIIILYRGKKYIIKRIIAIGGDKIRFEKTAVYLNSELLEEDYIQSGAVYREREYLVPEGFIFVMGDNRNNSYDSRDYAYISEAQIEGRAYTGDRARKIANFFKKSRVFWQNVDLKSKIEHLESFINSSIDKVIGGIS